MEVHLHHRPLESSSMSRFLSLLPTLRFVGSNAQLLGYTTHHSTTQLTMASLIKPLTQKFSHAAVPSLTSRHYIITGESI